jgi:hypothetical protein
MHIVTLHVSCVPISFPFRLVKRLLRRSPNAVISIWRLQLQYLQIFVWRYARQILRRDEDELSMFHFLRDVDKRLDRQLADFRIKEDIKFI